MTCGRAAIAAFALLASLMIAASPALAWGDEGHAIVALIAERYLTPAAAAQVAALLAADPDDLTAHDIAAAATWADKYRDSDRRAGGARYHATRAWHFVDLELDGPDLASACYGHPPLAPGQPASAGPAGDCVVDKIDQFAAELGAPATSAPSLAPAPAGEERVVALKFLLHFVGDLHQPLHASDRHDSGGNALHVTAEGHSGGSLHHYWDTELVRELGRDPAIVARDLAAAITPEQRQAWERGAAADWALESFAEARDHAYGRLPAAGRNGGVHLTQDYLDDAQATVARQLSRAGVRLALLLNRALDRANVARANGS